MEFGKEHPARLRDALGNRMVSDHLVGNIACKGDLLAVDRDAIRMI